MTRAFRIQYEGAVYHVMNRGNDGQEIFTCDEDRELFLSVLKETKDRYSLIIHSYCLMDNHYHIVLETKRANLSDAMRQINGIYCQRYNNLHDRRGHVFQSRFKSIICDKDDYFLNLARYVVRNPARAGLTSVDKLHKFRWSSYKETLHCNDLSEHITEPGFTLSFFSNNRLEAKRLYSDFVARGKDENILENLKGGFIFGGDEFVARINEMIEKEQVSKEVKSIERSPLRKPLQEIFTSFASTRERNNNILLAHKKNGYKMVTIADYLGIHYSTVSHIIKEELEKSQDPRRGT